MYLNIFIKQDYDQHEVLRRAQAAEEERRRSYYQGRFCYLVSEADLRNSLISEYCPATQDEVFRLVPSRLLRRHRGALLLPEDALKKDGFDLIKNLSDDFVFDDSSSERVLKQKQAEFIAALYDMSPIRHVRIGGQRLTFSRLGRQRVSKFMNDLLDCHPTVTEISFHGYPDVSDVLLSETMARIDRNRLYSTSKTILDLFAGVESPVPALTQFCQKRCEEAAQILRAMSDSLIDLLRHPFELKETPPHNNLYIEAIENSVKPWGQPNQSGGWLDIYHTEPYDSNKTKLEKRRRGAQYIIDLYQRLERILPNNRESVTDQEVYAEDLCCGLIFYSGWQPDRTPLSFIEEGVSAQKIEKNLIRDYHPDKVSHFSDQDLRDILDQACRVLSSDRARAWKDRNKENPSEIVRDLRQYYENHYAERQSGQEREACVKKYLDLIAYYENKIDIGAQPNLMKNKNEITDLSQDPEDYLKRCIVYIKELKKTIRTRTLNKAFQQIDSISSQIRLLNIALFSSSSQEEKETIQQELKSAQDSLYFLYERHKLPYQTTYESIQEMIFFDEKILERCRENLAMNQCNDQKEIDVIEDRLFALHDLQKQHQEMLLREIDSISGQIRVLCASLFSIKDQDNKEIQSKLDTAERHLCSLYESTKPSYQKNHQFIQKEIFVNERALQDCKKNPVLDTVECQNRINVIDDRLFALYYLQRRCHTNSAFKRTSSFSDFFNSSDRRRQRSGAIETNLANRPRSTSLV